MSRNRATGGQQELERRRGGVARKRAEPPIPPGSPDVDQLLGADVARVETTMKPSWTGSPVRARVDDRRVSAKVLGDRVLAPDGLPGPQRRLDAGGVRRRRGDDDDGLDGRVVDGVDRVDRGSPGPGEDTASHGRGGSGPRRRRRSRSGSSRGCEVGLADTAGAEHGDADVVGVPQGEAAHRLILQADGVAAMTCSWFIKPGRACGPGWGGSHREPPPAGPRMRPGTGASSCAMHRSPRARRPRGHPARRRAGTPGRDPRARRGSPGRPAARSLLQRGGGRH